MAGKKSKNRTGTKTQKKNQEKNDGTQLEDIVAQIEGMHLPPGCTIEIRRRVRDDDGVQIAELDIFISGAYGTSTWTMLIECRDRPSEGPAPRSWIQQLVGRRDDLNLNKVMAVSSTGFARGVAKYAKSKGIELRTLQTLTTEAVSACFPSTAPLIHRTGNFSGVRISLFSPDLPESLRGTRVQVDFKKPCIIENTTKDRLTLLELWSRILNTGNAFEGLELDGGQRKQTVVVDEVTRDAYSVEHDGMIFRFTTLEFDAELSIESSKMPLVHAGSYVNDKGEKLADVVQWKGKPSDQIQGITFIGIPKKRAPPQ